MKPSILFVDMNESLLPLVKAVAENGILPILMGPIVQEARRIGIACRAFEEFSPQDVQVHALKEIQRIAEELPGVIKDPKVHDAFRSSVGGILPFTGRRIFEKLLHLVERESAAALTFERLVKNNNLTLIVFRTENDPVQRTLIRFAQRHQVKTLQIAHAIFTKTRAKVAGEYERALRSDYIAVFGERARRFLEDIGCETQRIFLSGSPYWDRLYHPDAQIDMMEARKRLQLDPDKPVVLFGTSYPLASSAFYPSWAKQLAQSHLSLIQAIRQIDAPVQLILRPHPWELNRVGLSPQQEREVLDMYKEWLKNQGLTNVVISREKKFEAIRAADVVLTGAMTSLIAEAMILERPVIACPLEINFAYQPYTSKDGIVVVEDQARLPGILQTLLSDSSKRQEMVQQQKQAVKDLNYQNDGKALERLQAIILELAEKSFQINREMDLASTGKTACSDAPIKNQNSTQSSWNVEGELSMPNTHDLKEVYIHEPGTLSKGAVLDVGLKCTHSCGFCYYSYLDKSDDQFKGMRRAKFRTLDECQEILRLLKKNGFINFDYTGGEATLHPDIIEITRYAHQELGLKGRMITLGQFLMQKMKNCQNEFLIDDLLDAGLTNFLLSVHAVDSDLFHKITGESYDKLYRAMRHLDEKGFHYTTNTVVFEWNYRHLPQLAKQLTEHAVYLHNFIIMNAYYEWNKDGRAFGVQAKYSDIYPYLKEAVDILESHNVGVNIRYAPLCAVQGMEKNLVGMVGVRYDPYEWMNMAGHFGGNPEHCAAAYSLKDGEIEPYLTYRSLNGQLETGTKISGARGDVKYFTEACENCQAKNACDGIDGNYLKLYGGQEFSSYTKREEAPLHQARYDYTIPFIVKMSQYADMKGLVAREFDRLRTPTMIQPEGSRSVDLIQIDRPRVARGNSMPSSSVDESQSKVSSQGSSKASGPISPRVSVVVVSYNYGRYLAEAVKSVVSQTFQDFEVIIVNDGSLDNTAEVAESLVHAYPNTPITVINQVNAGQPAISRNNGIARARGQYILCLDADDKIASTMLEQCVQVLDGNSTLGIVYTDRLDFDGVDQVVQAGEYNFSHLRYANHISYCALFPRKMWEDIGGYRTNVKGCEDWDFWVAAGARGYFGRRIPEALFHYRRHDSGVYQEALAHLQERAAQIALNNAEAYTPSDIEMAKAFLASGPPKPQSNPSQESPLVSVIIPTYNRPERLIKAIQSVLDQTYRNVEVLVINDGGKEIEPLISALDDSGRVKYVRLSKNQERSHARNTGLRMARGKYVAYLDDDDRYYPHHIESLVSYLEKTGGHVAYSDAYRIYEELRNYEYVMVGRDLPYTREFDGDFILIQNHIPMLSLVHAKSCIDRVGDFDESLVTHEDWDLIIRLSRHFQVHHVKEVTAEYTWRMDGTSTTSRIPLDFLRTKKVIYRKNEDLFKQRPHLVPIRDQEIAGLEKRMQIKSFDCSIIVPIFNEVKLTEQCLTHLASVTDGVTYEVILIDNASTDKTPEFLSTLGGDVQVIRNQENLGFAKACNQGARVAAGKYLVFLNNDTIPQHGWLQALVDEADSHADVAVVGSKLLYADDTVQHAGVVFSRLDGLPHHWGTKISKNSPLVNQRREYKAVTAACMLVKREYFDRVGGFDEEYLNGFEDVDLCLTIRKDGGKIVYQPKSCLYHLESQSVGRHDHMQQNGDRLLSRWGDVWLADEDVVAFEHGCAIKQHSSDVKNRFQLVSINSEMEMAQWGFVARVEQVLDGQPKGLVQVRELKRSLEEYLSESAQWPNDPAVLEWAGNTCELVGFKQLAGGFWQKLVKITESPHARIHLAQLALDAKRFREAQCHLDALKSVVPESIEGAVLQGWVSVQQGDLKGAHYSFTDALATDPNNIKARMGLGVVNLEQGEVKEAFEIFLTILSDDPDDKEVMSFMIRAGQKWQAWGKVIEQLELFLMRNPADCEMRVALANAYQENGMPVEAERELNTVRLLSPHEQGIDELSKGLTGASPCAPHSSQMAEVDTQDIGNVPASATWHLSKP